MESIWTKNAEFCGGATLDGDIKCDVLVIGGGMAGILCAHELTVKGVDCILVEADTLCGGITKNTTAKITVQHGAVYSEIVKKYGDMAARIYFGAQNSALLKYQEMCRDIDCDFETQDAVLYSRDNRTLIEKEAAAYKKAGIKAEFTENVGLPFSAVGLRISGQAQFHPLKFAFAAAEKIRVFEHTKVLEFTPDTVVTNRGKIKAEIIIVATHFPIINRHGAYFLKMYQHRSYVVALSGADEVDGMYVDADKKGLSFRNYNGLLLLGGGSHRTGKKGGGWTELQDFAKRHYPHARQVARWATQDCMTLDGIPYIGQYSRNTPNLFVATGFNKWGMTSSMVAATLLTDMIMGQKSSYEDVFSPSRRILHPQLAVNAAESIAGLITPTAPRCPHMGCALKYNRQEHSWDCPCHGSRFTEEGELIDNPATDDRK